MRLLIVLAREYPRQSLLMLGCLLLAALAQGVGISTLIPVLGLLTGEGVSNADGGGGEIDRATTRVLATFGLEPSLGVLLGVVVVAVWVAGALFLLANNQVGYTVAHVATDLRLSLLRSLARTRWPYYIQQPVGSVANAFASEAERGSFAYYYATVIASNVIQVVIYTGIALAVSWQATIGAALVGGITMAVMLPLVRVTRRAGVKQTRLLKSLLSRLTDTLQAVKPLKAMARESLVGPLLERDTIRLNKVMRKLVFSKEVVRSLFEPITVTCLATGLFLAVSFWGIPLASLLVLVVLFARTLLALNRVIRNYQRMEQHQSAFWALRDLIREADAQQEFSGGTREARLEQAITFSGVDFSHEGTPVLQEADLEIPAGSITALLGPSGSGKTTIGDLVSGLLQPDRGEIRIDGVPMTEVDVRKWRGRIGYVPQELFLLHDTVALNVTLGDDSLGPRQVERALRRAGVWETVSSLPDGIETVVGERGSRFSGGQRQRIAIARALVHEPDLLILDEATTALDPETERSVWESLVALRGETTILAVSHQPALARVADRIYRVEEGRPSEVASEPRENLGAIA